MAIVLFFIFLLFSVPIKDGFYTEMNELKCIDSALDGNKYCVRERANSQSAVELLASTREKMIALVEYLKANYGQDDRVKRLVDNFDSTQISEILPTSKYTAYNVGKGRNFAFCLNKKKEDNEHLIDPHTLMFVAIHELAHVATLSYSHNEEFWITFKYLLTKADECNIHKPVNYHNEHMEYCGMTIKENPYFL